MENEKVLIAGGLLVGAYLLFGGGKKKSGSGLPSGEGSDDLSEMLDEFEEDLELEADELADLADNNGNGLDLDDPGDLEEYYEEEINERAEALADQLTSISASGGSGGGGGGEKKDEEEKKKKDEEEKNGNGEGEVDWCGTMITQAQANERLAEMMASQAASTTGGSYQEETYGSNCWQWIEPPPQKEIGPPAGIQWQRPPSQAVATGRTWSGGVAPVQTQYTGGPATSYQGMVNPYSFVSTQH